MADTFLEKVKPAVRRTGDLIDNEINDLIEACKADLTRLGVDESKIVVTDPTISHIMICYCKWQLNFQGDGEKWGKLYHELRQDLSLDSSYKPDGN